MNRIDLSAHTRIEDMNGVRKLVTTSHEIACPWPRREEIGTVVTWLEDKRCWCIPLTAVAPVYEFVNGEPWARAVFQYGQVGRVYDCGIQVVPGGPMEWEYYMHRRAAVVCDTTEQFRALHGELKEARDGGR